MQIAAPFSLQEVFPGAHEPFQDPTCILTRGLNIVSAISLGAKRVPALRPRNYCLWLLQLMCSFIHTIGKYWVRLESILEWQSGISAEVY